MKKVYLDNNWLLSGGEYADITACVPGCVHMDLLRNKLISEPFWRDNNTSLQWIEKYDWVYRCSFDAETSQPAELVFEGLDTYAHIFLNGVLLCETSNMFIPHRADVTGRLKSKANLLEVYFRSPIKSVEGMPKNSGAFTAERLRTRRIQCTYGWDWVDRFVTCGIFRPVYIEYGNDMHVDNIYIYTENIDRFGAQMYLEINFTGYEKGGIVNVEVLSPDNEKIHSFDFYSAEKHYVCRFDIENPRLWYPNGYGNHPLYRIVIKTGENEFNQNFGVRTLKVLQLTDSADGENYNKAINFQSNEIGRVYDNNKNFSGFAVIVNGIRIFCSGANWVPCEPFPSEEKETKYTVLLQRAQNMGLNMLRVWGGGYFENEIFYDECDRRGILVTQDFLMACGRYPEDEEWFISELRLESEFAAKYLRNHPSLAWWSGDNENAVDGSDTQINYTGRASAVKGLSDNVYKYDRSRQFFRSSPYGGDTYGSVTKGTTHNTNYINLMFEYFTQSECEDYKEYFARFGARFVAEEPVFGASNLNSMLKFMEKDDLFDPDEKIILYHTKTNPWLKREILHYVSDFAKKILGEFKDTHDRFFKYKYIQYEWMRIVFENARRHLGYCDGLIFWMFSDCWPTALGWSIVDYYTAPKPAYYIFSRCAKKIVTSVYVKNNRYVLNVSNSSDENRIIEAEAKLCEISSDMESVKTEKISIKIPPYSAAEKELSFGCSAQYAVICDSKWSEGTDRSFYKDGKLNIKKAENAITILERTDNSITVVAGRYVHAVELEGNYIFSDNYFSMLKGETKTIGFSEFDNENGGDFTVETYSFINNI